MYEKMSHYLILLSYILSKWNILLLKLTSKEKAIMNKLTDVISPENKLISFCINRVI